MLHDPAGNVYGVCRDFCAGVERVILQFFTQSRSPLLLCGSYGGLLICFSLPFLKTYGPLLGTFFHFDAVWIMCPFLKLFVGRQAYSLIAWL